MSSTQDKQQHYIALIPAKKCQKRNPVRKQKKSQCIKCPNFQHQHQLNLKNPKKKEQLRTCCDSPKPLLTCCIPYLQLDSLSIKLNGPYFEVDAIKEDNYYEFRGETNQKVART